LPWRGHVNLRDGGLRLRPADEAIRIEVVRWLKPVPVSNPPAAGLRTDAVGVG
jgi:hypothetical protein